MVSFRLPPSCFGRPVRQSPPEPAALPLEIAAIRHRATLGYVLAQVQWGNVLLNSVHISPDPVAARQWFLIAAQAGYGPAHNMLGRCYHFGWGCPVDLGKAAASYKMAGELGDAWGQYNLGIMLMRGLGTPPDLRKALSLFRDAAQAGHAKSMNLVARFTEEGWETPKNMESALNWYRRSAEGGDYRGQHNYATALLEQGRKEEALKWWRKAVDKATSDILLAMEQQLSKLGTSVDGGILELVRKRLAVISKRETAAP